MRAALYTRKFGEPWRESTRDPRLDERGATFVTLSRHGQLRGCIGSIEARRSLRDDVYANAIAAATRDPRFAPLRHQELGATSVAVSKLSSLEALRFTDEADLCSQLRPEIDGVVVIFGDRRGTLLPKMWKRLPDARAFIEAIKTKVGLPANFWDASIEVKRYTAIEWQERAFTLEHDE